jgi:predicted DNA-binding transcriptional regulator AlpA
MGKSKAVTAKVTNPLERASDDGPIAPARRLIPKQRVLEMLGGSVGASTLWGWMKDGDFPHPFELGPRGGRSSTIAWDEREVATWIANRPRRKLGQHEFRGKGRSLRS